jgi:hypothetical protein
MKRTLFFLVITSIALRLVGMEGEVADRGWYRKVINITIANRSGYDLVVHLEDRNQNEIDLSNDHVARTYFKMIKTTIPTEPAVIDKNSSFKINATSNNFPENAALSDNSLLVPESLTINSERITFILNLFTVYANGARTGPQKVSFTGELVQSKENYFLAIKIGKLNYIMENRSNANHILFDPEQISITFNRTELTRY